MTTAANPLLVLLQVTDTAFPSGTFAHSFGLEQLVADRRVQTPGELESFVRSVIVLSVAKSDAVAAVLTSHHANDSDRGAIFDVDQRLFAMKGASELRNTSTSAGRRTLEELVPYAPALDWLLAAVQDGRTSGTHAVALGVAAQSFGIEARDIACALMFGAANAVLQAGMRLLPVSHRDVQAALHRLRPLVSACADDALNARGIDSLCSFQPLQEVAAMRHRVAETRMFAS